MEKVFKTKNLSELQVVSRWLADKLTGCTIVLLEGPLGSGKTALVKHLAQHLGYAMRKVKSPTFSLLNTYQVGDYIFSHLDLYRLDSHDYFLLEEMKELLSGKQAVVLIEWPEKMDLAELLAIASRIISVNIQFAGKNFRKFHICVN